MSDSDEDDSDIGRLVGTTVADKYRIDRVIGRGGMGAVYQATHLTIGKRVALKFLDRAGRARQRLGNAIPARGGGRERRRKRAHRPHLRFGRRRRRAVSGDGAAFGRGPASTSCGATGGSSSTDALRITAQVLRALSRAHEAGIIHRDLKPDNVFLCQRDDDAMFVKIVDFGISKLARRATADTLTRRGTVLGTAFYMSPEQAQAFRDIDGRTDLFSLGAILFEMLAGRPPHVGTAYEAVLISICTKDADDIRDHADDVPEAVAQVIKKALARDRDRTLPDRRGVLRRAGSGCAAHRRHQRTDASLARALEAVEQLGLGARHSAGDSSRDAVFGTAGGTAVRSSSTDDAKAARRRTIVTAVVAALGAFVVTAFWMARNAGSRLGRPRPARGRRAPRTSSAPTSRRADGSSPEPVRRPGTHRHADGFVPGSSRRRRQDSGRPNARRTPARPHYRSGRTRNPARSRPRPTSRNPQARPPRQTRG